MDLFAVYAKTPKGLRKRNTMFVSLLSPLQSKVLALVDGSTSVKTILTKLDNVNGDDLDNALNSLLQNGFIRPTTIAPNTAVEWLPTSNFTPMVIEEFSDFDEVDAKEQETATQKAKQKEQAERAKAEAKIKAQLEAERKAKEAEEARLKAEAERKAREEAERQAKEEAKRLEAERKAKEAAELKARQEAEAKAKAEAEEKARIEAEARAKAEAELKAKQEAERLAAEQKAKEEAEQQARLEAERIAREAEEARQREEAEKLEAERKAKEEADLKAKQEAERLAAEQKAKEEAEQQARLEAERITREAEEARQREETERKAREEAEKLEAERKAAEEKAKAEAAQQAKQDAETKAKAAAEEKARLEIERITREAKEARKHAEAEKKAKKEAEKKAKAEAEEQARLESERKAKEEAELKAKQEAERLAAEQKAKEEAEVQARLEAERIAREVEEARLREEAELQAKVEAEEQARLQAEAEAEAAAEQAEREAEAAQQKAKQAKKLQALIIAERRQEAAHQKKLEEERALKRALEEEEIVLEGEYAETGAEDAEDDVSIASYEDKDRMLHDMVDEDDGFVPTGMEAEETSVAPKAAAITAPAEPETEYETDEQKLEALKRAAAAETHERKSSLSMMEKKRAITRKIRQWMQLPASLLKHTLRTSLLVGILLFAAIVGLLPYVPLKPLIEPVQKLAETQLNTTVNVRKASASLLPMPHLVLRDVEIGDNGQKIGLVKLWPEISKLQESQKVVKTLEISDANVSQENFGQIMGWLTALGDSPQLKVESIRLHKVVLTARNLEFGEFNGEISQTADHKIQMIQLNSTDDKLQVKIMPKGGNADITLEASQWALPLRQEIKFNKLTASGSASADRLEFSRIQGELYEGELDASAVLSWGGQWQTTGEFSLKHASAADVMQAFGSPIGVSGMVDWKGRFNGQSQEAQQLSANMNLSSDFAMEHGQLDDLDIGGAVVAKGNQSLAGDSTRFDSLRGTLQYSNQRYSLRNLALQSKQLRARADMSIAADGEISGNLSANLSTAGRSFNTNAALSGRGSDIKLR